MKLMRYIGDSADLHGHVFYVIDRPTVLGGVRARFRHAPEAAWYDFNADEFEDIEGENV